VFHACKELCPELADIDDSIFAGFGGGFAGTGRVCGAVTGATAVVSYLNKDKNDPTNRDKIYEDLRNLFSDFEAEYGSLNCRDIIRIDFTDPEESKKFLAEKYEQVCKPLVKYVVEQIYNLR
jgi:C_GCAxxG_C_C family probable redox protein